MSSKDIPNFDQNSKFIDEIRKLAEANKKKVPTKVISNHVFCTVCNRNFKSINALWGHQNSKCGEILRNLKKDVQVDGTSKTSKSELKNKFGSRPPVAKKTASISNSGSRAYLDPLFLPDPRDIWYVRCYLRLLCIMYYFFNWIL